MIALALDEALRDPHLLGAALGPPTSWGTWLTTLRAAAGLPLDPHQRATFATIAGNRNPPAHRVRELWCVVGRGGGKSRMAAASAVHAALLQRHRLAPGEIGCVLVLSPTVGQAKTVFEYALAFIEASPVLRGAIIDTTANEIRLRHNIVIAVHPNSFRSVRGRTLVCCVFDEASFWRDEASANPDVETYRAVLPSLIRTGGQLIAISTPYRKLGLLYAKHRDYFGQDDGDVLVVQGASRVFNPLLSETNIRKAMDDDPEGAVSEWDAEFRDDISAFLSDADIDRCVDHDRPLETPWQPGFRYRAFVDPSGGRHDHFCVAIGHRDGDNVIIDAVRGRAPPANPQSVCAEFADLLRDYKLREVTGDNFAAEWVTTAFREVGIKYTKAEWPKSKLYVEALPLFTRRLLSLPDHPRLLRELRLLERRTHVGGKDSVDHGRAGSDDYANTVAGVAALLRRRRPTTIANYWINPETGRRYDDPGPPATRIREVRIPEALTPAVKGFG